MGTIELWTIGICPPTADEQCQAKAGGSPRCRHRVKKYAQHKQSKLVVGVCASHHKKLRASFVWRDYEVSSV